MDMTSEHTTMDMAKSGDVSHEVKPVEVPQHIAQSDVQTMLINYTDWKQSKVRVTDPNSQEVLYTVEFRMRKPNLRFYINEDPEMFASTIIHSFRPRVEVDIRGQALEMKPKSHFSCEYHYTSPCFQNQTLKWRSKSGWKTLDYVCLDENEMPLARVIGDQNWGMKLGRMELLGPVGNNEAAKEELLITGLTLTWQMLVNNLAAVSAASA